MTPTGTTMHHIQKHITQILDGEAQPRYDSPELAGVLADTHAILGDRNAQQALFLERIRCAGGVAFVARDLRDVLRTLGEAQAP